MKLKTFLLAGIWLFFGISFQSVQAKTTNKKDTIKNASPSTTLTKIQKTTTEGTVTIEGQKINYTAVAGTLILENSKDSPTCSLFYVAYFKKGGNKTNRPVTFIYNGGPGSSSLWLHMGAWGPQRVEIKDTERVLPPYKTVNNQYSLLDVSDLVFIDAPATGFSRIITRDKGGVGKGSDFFSIDGDARAFAQFITRFITEYDRWDSPKYLFGESYGTFRSAIVSNILETQDNVDLNGVILLSQLLSYTNSSDGAPSTPGNNLPYELALPSAAATAWYHHKLPNQPEELKPFLKKVEHFALSEYAVALNQGDLLDSVSFHNIAFKLHNFTGLPINYIKKANLRISGPEFEKMMLADENKVTGRLDTRFTGPEMDPLSKTPHYDPHSATFSAAFVGTFNNYLRTSLKFGDDMTYRPTYYSKIYSHWDFRHNRHLPNVMNDLAHAMVYNPKMKVMLNMGYYDLGTPYFEGEYEMHQLPIPKSLQKNISYAHYFSGHMVYLNIPSLKELHDNVAAFIKKTHKDS